MQGEKTASDVWVIWRLSDFWVISEWFLSDFWIGYCSSCSFTCITDVTIYKDTTRRGMQVTRVLASLLESESIIKNLTYYSNNHHHSNNKNMC